MKKFLLIIPVVVFCASVSFGGTVGISVTPDNWNVGTGGSGEWTSSSFTVTNTGNTSANVKIKASDTRNWQITAGMLSKDKFSLLYTLDGNAWNALSTSESTAISGFNGSSSANFTLKFKSPPSVSDTNLHEVQISTVTLSVVQSNPYSFLTKWEIPVQGPYDAAVDAAGNVFVAVEAAGMVRKYASNGELIKEIGNSPGSSAVGIALDSSGNLYVADANNMRIMKFSNDGDLISIWNNFGAEIEIVDVYVDRSDIVYVYWISNGGTKFMQKFNINGELVGQIENMVVNRFVVDDSGNFYCTMRGSSSEWPPAPAVNKYSPDGVLISSWTIQFNPAATPINYYSASGIMLDRSNNVLVGVFYEDLNGAGTDYCEIQKFSSDGVFELKFGALGAGDGEFTAIAGISTDSSGNIYVCDSGNRRVQVFAGE